MRVICTGVHACIISVDYKRFIDLKKKNSIYPHTYKSRGSLLSYVELNISLLHEISFRGNLKLELSTAQVHSMKECFPGCQR